MCASVTSPLIQTQKTLVVFRRFDSVCGFQLQSNLRAGGVWPGVMWPVSGGIHRDQLWEVRMIDGLMNPSNAVSLVWHLSFCLSRCASGFYGNPHVVGGACVRCDCNGNVNISEAGHCDTITGECLRCLGNTAGRHCEICQSGYYGDAVHAKDCHGETHTHIGTHTHTHTHTRTHLCSFLCGAFTLTSIHLYSLTQTLTLTEPQPV